MIFPIRATRSTFRSSFAYYIKDYKTLTGRLNIERLEGGGLVVSFEHWHTPHKFTEENRCEHARAYSWVHADDQVSFVGQLKTWVDKQFSAADLAAIEAVRDRGIRKARKEHSEIIDKLIRKGYEFNQTKLPRD